MNIIGTMVGISLMGATVPMVMNMSIAPAEAAKRAEIFGAAETAAVVFSATYEGTTDDPVSTDTCTASPREGTENAYAVTCTHGSGKYVQSVTRAFRLAIPEKDLNNGDIDGAGTIREFQFNTPTHFSGHQCPVHDPWGVYGHNDLHYDALGGACMPDVAWTQTKYQFSNPDSWLYDINNIKGWGGHPDYILSD